MKTRRLAGWLAAAVLTGGCGGSSQRGPGKDGGPTPTVRTSAGDPSAPADPSRAGAKSAADGPTPHRTPPPAEPPSDIPTRYDAPARLVAFGDVHGDLAALREVLRIAGAIESGSDDWAGGELVVVQTGDQLDRGDDEQAILDLLATLAEQARGAGGAVHVLNGNHELMNVAGDLRYVTEGGLRDFEDVEGLALGDPRLASLPPSARARMAAFMPGGPYARLLAQRNTVVIVGRTVFAHAGVLPAEVPKGIVDLERLNRDARSWLAGSADDADAIAARLMQPESVVWTRVYAEGTEEVCKTLHQALTLLDADRMVVGHTVQKDGITSACDGRLWRVDVGMARHYGGKPQALAIEGDEVTVLPG